MGRDHGRSRSTVCAILGWLGSTCERDFQSLNLRATCHDFDRNTPSEVIGDQLHSLNGPVLDRPIELSQHTSAASTERLIDEGVDASVSCAGDALANALAEAAGASVKKRVHPPTGPWWGDSMKEVPGLAGTSREPS